MAEQSITKRCSHCKEIKPLSEFYKNRNGKDGLHLQCKTCKKQYMQQYRKTDKGKSAQRRYKQSQKGKVASRRYEQSKKGRDTQKQYRLCHPERQRAKNAVNKAVRTGKLPRPDTLQCHYCPEQAKDYHHHKGYAPEHWLDVIPACRNCHNNTRF